MAASVEGLRPDAVVIIDSFGRPLSRPSIDDDEQLGAAGQVERQQRLEREMGTRVVALLEPVIGPERVRVNVALKLNPTTVEQTEERFDPDDGRAQQADCGRHHDDHDAWRGAGRCAREHAAPRAGPEKPHAARGPATDVAPAAPGRRGTPRRPTTRSVARRW